MAIALAVAALIITMSIMNGFRSELTAKILGFNGHAFVVGGAMSPGERSAMVGRLRRTPGVVQAIPLVESQALVQGATAAAGAVVRGLSPADLQATPIVSRGLKRGSLADFGRGEDGGDGILIGDRLAASLDVGVGDTVSIISPNGSATAFGEAPVSKAYRIIGIFSVGMSEYDQTFIYMPLAQAQLFFGRDAAVDFIEIMLSDPDRAHSLISTLGKVAGPGAVVSDWTEKNRAYFGALQVERNVMRLIFMFIVALAAMNIISGIVMLVKNKSRDIAILRTIGASRGAILRIFFMVGAVIGLIGTLIGLSFGVLFCLNIGSIQNFIEWITGAKIFNADVYFLAHVPAKIDWREVVAVVIWSFGAACAFTFPPALRASGLDPVEALRYE